MYIPQTNGFEAYYRLRLPPLTELPVRDKDAASLEARVVESLLGLGISDRLIFCNQVHQYYLEGSALLSARAKEHGTEASVPGWLEALKEVPDPDLYFTYNAQDNSDMAKRIKRVAIIVAPVIGFAAATIGAGALADNYLETHSITNHLVTGVASVLGTVGGLVGGCYFSDWIFKHYENKTQAQRQVATDKFVQAVRNYIAEHKQANVINS
jgi:hypothetical protein